MSKLEYVLEEIKEGLLSGSFYSIYIMAFFGACVLFIDGLEFLDFYVMAVFVLGCMVHYALISGFNKENNDLRKQLAEIERLENKIKVLENGKRK
jgi:cell shape-determining protein MreC